MEKVYLTESIDRAIVMTQYDLRGFLHPVGFRIKGKDSKSLDAITNNLMAFAIKGSKDEDLNYARYHESSFDDYLKMCKNVAKDCGVSQKEAIQLIIQEIVKQNKELRAEVTAGTRKASPYLRPLEKDNPWGKAVSALSEAFEVKIEDN